VTFKQSCLIIDDSDVVRKVMRHTIEGLGFDVEEEADTTEALARCKKVLPDMVVLDWHIAGCQPIDFIPALRSLPMGRHVKILYVMTNNDPAEIGRAITAGADGYMFKPFLRVTLEAKITALLTRKRDPEDETLDYMTKPIRVALGAR